MNQFTLKVFAPASAPELTTSFDNLADAEVALNDTLSKYSPAPRLESRADNGAARYYYQSKEGRAEYHAPSDSYRVDGEAVMIRWIELS